jgi:SAM-dependent methyltransferase
MRPLIYGELVSWYRLLDPPADHQEEAAAFQASFERAVSPAPLTLLELGSGAGHNAAHLKARFQCTLTDISEEMLGLSRALNPECTHVAGDMRTLRLGRTFDAVLVHDAIMYMTTEAELVAAARTAFEHTRPGGAALFVPDCTRETFHDAAELLAETDEGRALRCLAWTWDPDPTDDTYVVDYALLLRDGAVMKAVHDRHLEGLFPRATWLATLTSVGFRVQMVERPLGDGTCDEVFLGVRAG